MAEHDFRLLQEEIAGRESCAQVLWLRTRGQMRSFLDSLERLT